MNRSSLQQWVARSPGFFSLILLVIAIVINAILQPNLLSLDTINNNMRVFLPMIFLAVGQYYAPNNHLLKKY